MINKRLEMIRNIRLELSGVKKEGFPIPSPSGSEDKDTYISRCISEISSEYEHDQAIAICIGKWEER